MTDASPAPSAPRAPDERIVAIVWAPHEARTASFARWLGAELHNVHYLKAKRPWMAPAKYVLQWFATWWLLLRRRPRFVYVTNSPPVAGLCVMAWCRLTATEFILDTHPPGLFNRKWGWSRPIQRFTARRARMNVVDQEQFRALFASWGAPALILENPPKEIPFGRLEPPAEADAKTFVYVGTFADDEPVEILLEAARRRPDVTFYLLGDPTLAPRALTARALGNVRFTGYLTGDEYWQRLQRSQAIVVLTTHAASLLGGAMDGLYLGKPLILSDQPTLRERFTGGAVFISNTADGAIEGIERALRDGERLEREIRQLRDETTERWHRAFAQLTAIVDDGGAGAAAASSPSAREATR